MANLIRTDSTELTGAVDYDLVQVTLSGDSGANVLNLKGVSGRIGRCILKSNGACADGLKIHATPLTHDLTIDYLEIWLAAISGAVHQDGVQCMAGKNILVRTFAICGNANKGSYRGNASVFIRGGLPQDIDNVVFQKGAMCGFLQKGLQMGTSTRSGMGDAIASDAFGAYAFAYSGESTPSNPVKGKQTVVQGLTWEQAKAYAAGTTPTPTPPTPQPPTPQPDPCAAVKAELATTKAELATMSDRVTVLGAQVAQWNDWYGQAP